MTHSLISREYFRCAANKPFVRHDTRVWESSAGKEPRLRSADGRLLLGDELLDDWRSRALKGSSVRLRAYYDSHPSADSRLTLDPTSKNRYGDPMPKIERQLDAAADGARRRDARALHRGVRADGQGQQRPADRQADGFDLLGSSRRRLPHGHRSGDAASCDSYGRTHDHENLFVIGAPTLPTGGCTNGTLTFVALSLRSAGQDLRGRCESHTRGPDFGPRLEPQGDHRRDRRRAARCIDRDRDLQSRRCARARSRDQRAGSRRWSSATSRYAEPGGLRSRAGRRTEQARRRAGLPGRIHAPAEPGLRRRVSRSHPQHSPVATAEVPGFAPAATGAGRPRGRERRHCSFCEQGPRCRSDRAPAASSGGAGRYRGLAGGAHSRGRASALSRARSSRSSIASGPARPSPFRTRSTAPARRAPARSSPHRASSAAPG